LDEVAVRAVNLDTIGAAAMALRAAWRKSATVRRTSSVVSARGVGISFIPAAVNICPPGAIAAGATA
jgi:hypothetical protein